MKKHIKIAISFAVAGMLLTGTCLAAIPANGKNGKIEWRQVSKYQLPYSPVDIAHSLDGNYSFILTENNTVIIYDRKGTIQGSIPVGKGVSAIDIDPQGNYMYLIDSVEKITSTIAIDFVVNISTTNVPVKGDLNAPVTIAVFSDFQ